MRRATCARAPDPTGCCPCPRPGGWLLQNVQPSPCCCCCSQAADEAPVVVGCVLEAAAGRIAAAAAAAACQQQQHEGTPAARTLAHELEQTCMPLPMLPRRRVTHGPCRGSCRQPACPSATRALLPPSPRLPWASRASSRTWGCRLSPPQTLQQAGAPAHMQHRAASAAAVQVQQRVAVRCPLPDVGPLAAPAVLLAVLKGGSVAARGSCVPMTAACTGEPSGPPGSPAHVEAMFFQ